MEVILETHRLYLRRLTQSDAQHLFDLDSDPEVMRYMRARPCQSLKDAQAQLQRYLDEYQSLGISRWAVIGKSDEAFVGLCGLRLWPGQAVPDLGYRLHSPYWGCGYATEAAGAVLHFALHGLGYAQVGAVVIQGNLGSIRVLEKIGMQYVKTAWEGDVETLIYQAQANELDG
ncbi:MAG: hypothetical protein ETSY1_18515 [Candidatus Entotheonella factor]|uniref:N-acetyltransferase domain-containing protein n=1 Tax=Entotheonella factor TaxID=1429438 RepID=W4LKI6_ENTF1|nr:MAG: hypothetical protein ETSY1_18515 [Candidatus Entotheonella factor]